MRQITTLGIDTAKNVFQLHGVDAQGNTVLHKRVSRKQVLPLLAQLPPCLVGLEACGGSHYWAREIAKLGHTVKLMAPQAVKPYVQGNKTAGRDAEGICEAASRPRVRAVAINRALSQILLRRAMQGQLPLSGWGLRSQGVEQFGRSEALVSGLHHHLSFLNHVHEFDPDQGVLGCLERFEPQHGPCYPLYTSMILLHHVV